MCDEDGFVRFTPIQKKPEPTNDYLEKLRQEYTRLYQSYPHYTSALKAEQDSEYALAVIMDAQKAGRHDLSGVPSFATDEQLQIVCLEIYSSIGSS